jgi:hypothetical protein
MRSLLRPRISFAYVVSGLSLVVALTGGALAAFAGSNGSLHGCVDTKGTLTLAKAGKKCGKGRRSLEWNRRGATGAIGPDGNKGPLGRPGKAAVTFSRHLTSPQEVPGVVTVSGVKIDILCDSLGVHFVISAPGATVVDYSGWVTDNGGKTVVHDSQTELGPAAAARMEIDVIARAHNRSDWVHLVLGGFQNSGNDECDGWGRVTPSS